MPVCSDCAEDTPHPNHAYSIAFAPLRIPLGTSVRKRPSPGGGEMRRLTDDLGPSDIGASNFDDRHFVSSRGNPSGCAAIARNRGGGGAPVASRFPLFSACLQRQLLSRG